MKNEKFKENKFMMFSNIFLALPVIFAAIYGEWLYCFFASGLLVFSPLFHWYRIVNTESFYFKLFKTMDWMFAIGAFFYMYYYIFTNTHFHEKTFLFTALTAVVIFFGMVGRKQIMKSSIRGFILSPR